MATPGLRPLVISMGEPAGIGTELLYKAYRALRDEGLCFFTIDDPERLAVLPETLTGGVDVIAIKAPSEAASAFKHGLPVLSLPQHARASLGDVVPGKPSAATASAVIGSIEAGVAVCANGDTGGLVTLPIQKSTLQKTGFSFPGHTEFLGDLTASLPLPQGDVRGPVMMLAAGNFRTVPLTVHVPIRDVPVSIRRELIVERCLVTAQALVRDFGIASPRLAIAGLNPHAGEDGTMGVEDQDVIAPAIADLRAAGVDAIGPLPADTMFHAEARANYDAALAMYHDQALIPIKTVAFHDAVNVTLGLPIVRTSPDHGTGLDIAGQGIARPDSLIAAIRMAAAMADAREALRA
ncbi:MAG: 4-hydroxythreonine-4-phosphate dehydrogenase PdxA [Pseudomonadota bacterium]